MFIVDDLLHDKLFLPDSLSVNYLSSTNLITSSMSNSFSLQTDYYLLVCLIVFKKAIICFKLFKHLYIMNINNNS